MSVRSLAAVKAHFSQVIDEVAGTHERVTVTKNGSPVAVLLAVEDDESLTETAAILSDPEYRVGKRLRSNSMAAGPRGEASTASSTRSTTTTSSSGSCASRTEPTSTADRADHVGSAQPGDGARLAGT